MKMAALIEFKRAAVFKFAAFLEVGRDHRLTFSAKTGHFFVFLTELPASSGITDEVSVSDIQKRWSVEGSIGQDHYILHYGVMERHWNYLEYFFQTIG